MCTAATLRRCQVAVAAGLHNCRANVRWLRHCTALHRCHRSPVTDTACGSSLAEAEARASDSLIWLYLQGSRREVVSVVMCVLCGCRWGLHCRQLQPIPVVGSKRQAGGP